ncbi:hypothetical protein [Gracilinema caldarium]|uniref:hypothetical protein n=1 Tax=Gracilinema caldarium TaxID=215591 RepID=UPI0026EF7515|nr:hypothetical protein [Gracilinema caldarium]
MKPMQNIASRLSFFIGFSLMILGSVLFIASLSGIAKVATIPASLFLLIGVLFALFAFKLVHRLQYMFLAAFFIQLGLFLLLIILHTIPYPFSKVWPAISIFAGTALIPAARFRSNTSLVRFIVPAIAFVVLGVVLLIFSLDLVTFSFKRFILTAWPLLLLFAGIFLLLLSLYPKQDEKDSQNQ